jgi:hypothetical protein
MHMTLVEKVDEVLVRAGQAMTVYAISGAIREMFAERVDLSTLIEALEGEASFVRTDFRSYGLDTAKRGERLADSFVF